MIIGLMGAPGAGKGSQASRMQENLGFKKISTGDVIRDQIKRKTQLGQKIENIVNSGSYVSDEILENLLHEELAKADKKVLLDGYPRTLVQAEALPRIAQGHKILGMIYLDVPDDIIIKRLSGRRVCSQCTNVCHVMFNPPQKEKICDRCGGPLSQRADDTEEKIKVRLAVFQKETLPVVTFYQNKNIFYKIDGNEDEYSVYIKVFTLCKDLGVACGDHKIKYD